MADHTTDSEAGSPAREVQQIAAVAEDSARQVRRLREEAGLTQRQLADRMTELLPYRWMQNTVMKTETIGKGHRPIRLQEAWALAVALGVANPVAITGGSDDLRASVKADAIQANTDKLINVMDQLGRMYEQPTLADTARTAIDEFNKLSPIEREMRGGIHGIIRQHAGEAFAVVTRQILDDLINGKSVETARSRAVHPAHLQDLAEAIRAGGQGDGESS